MSGSVFRQPADAVVGQAVAGGIAMEGEISIIGPDPMVHASSVAAQPEASVGGFDDAADHFPDAG